jgi:hypothetical protein
MLPGSLTIASSFIRPWPRDRRARPGRRCAPEFRPRAISLRALAPAGRVALSGRRRKARPPRARRREHARVVHGVEARRGHAGGQPAQQRLRVHVHRDRAVSVRLLQRDDHQSVFARLDALRGDRRTQHVAQPRLAARGVERARPRGRVPRYRLELQGQTLGPGSGAERRFRGVELPGADPVVAGKGREPEISVTPHTAKARASKRFRMVSLL